MSVYDYVFFNIDICFFFSKSYPIGNVSFSSIFPRSSHKRVRERERE